jgi:hypothetical protein
VDKGQCGRCCKLALKRAVTGSVLKMQCEGRKQVSVSFEGGGVHSFFPSGFAIAISYLRMGLGITKKVFQIRCTDTIQ